MTPDMPGLIIGAMSVLALTALYVYCDAINSVR